MFLQRRIVISNPWSELHFGKEIVTMVRLSLAVVLLVLAVDNAAGLEVCHAIKGKKVFTFSNTAEATKFPCKYNAIKNLTCGKWRITLSPGNALDSHRNKKYILRTMYVVVENVNTQLTWEGRSDLKIAKKYKLGFEQSPFRKKRGSLETSDVFNYGDLNADNEVSMTEKDNDFKITFGLYEPFGEWHRSSGFRFECFSNNFLPSSYPTQLCGNGTKQEVKKFKKSKGWRDNRMVTLFFNVFANEDIVQMVPHCIAAARSMQKKCKTDGERYNAAKLCWPILGKNWYMRCYTRNGDAPISVFRDCVEYICTGSQASCRSLASQLDMCPELQEVSNAVKNQCLPSLVAT